MHVPSLIARKREGEELSALEIELLVNGYMSGEVADYQMSAFGMAVYFKGMSAVETGAMTRAIILSGEVFKHAEGHPKVVDKHSTGGIGDKVSLVLAPLVASAGCRVPMVSGRGLGITGGTLDKLESIPGFRVDLDMDEAAEILARVGVVMMGQTERFCPADKKLYALRDVTGTVPSIALITASIMSKKMAESLDRLVLDVKFGSGAFMKTKADARILADGMISVGKEMGVEVFAVLNEMSEPTGRAVGNALEVIEALECLAGGGPLDLRKVVLDLSEKIAGVSRAELERLLDDGTALKKFRELVEAQGGNVDDLDKLAEIHKAPVIKEIRSGFGGNVTRVDAGTIGQASLELGAGRSKSTDNIDFAVGFDCLIKRGEQVARGDLIGRIHARSQEDAEKAEGAIRRAIEVV
ncbi:MAG: thymidine phosphorylase [Armatimonadetes bacterium]|nr:thymidine phosphorylase [Akkermansiaceae bacterium]